MVGWCVPANGLCPYQRVATRRYGYLIPAGMIGVSGKRRGGGQRLTNYLVGNQFICIFTEVKLEALLAFGFVIFHCWGAFL